MRIDLNADVGESFGAYSIGHDAALMKSMTSVNVAAGFHAGNASVLRDTIRLAKASGIAIGAASRLSRSCRLRRGELRLAALDAEDFVLYQVAARRGRRGR